MAYFGCETKANKIAYILFFVFLIIGIGLMIGTAEEWVDCMEDMQECALNRNLTGLDMQYMEAYFQDPSIFTNPTQKCREWYPEGTANYVPDCVFCSTMANYCLLPYSAMFYLGVAIVVLSLVPCMFCCCFSKRPQLLETMKGID